MKTLKNLTLTSLAILALVSGTMQGRSQIQVSVDPSKPWSGYMNVYDLGGGYLWGSGWGAAALTAVMTSTTLTLGPNVNCYNPTDPYWVNPDGSGNKRMEANFYVDVGTAFGGNSVTFSGSTLANTLVAGYQSVAVIKEFTSTYGFVGMTTASLVGGNDFSVSRNIGAGNIAQYGFMTTGLVANPATVSDLGVAIVAVPEPSALALLGVLGLPLYLWRRRQ